MSVTHEQVRRESRGTHDFANVLLGELMSGQGSDQFPAPCPDLLVSPASLRDHDSRDGGAGVYLAKSTARVSRMTVTLI